MGTAFMGTLGVGMIPVGYIDIHEPEGNEVLCDDWDVDSLKDAITEASGMSEEWCKDASQQNIIRYKKYCEPSQVEENFITMFSNENVKKALSR